MGNKSTVQKTGEYLMQVNMMAEQRGVLHVPYSIVYCRAGRDGPISKLYITPLARRLLADQSMRNLLHSYLFYIPVARTSQARRISRSPASRQPSSSQKPSPVFPQRTLHRGDPSLFSKASWCLSALATAALSSPGERDPCLQTIRTRERWRLSREEILKR